MTGMGDEVSKTVSERTYRGNTTEKGKEEAGQGKEQTESPVYRERVHNM